MNDEALLREKAATLTRMLNLQGTIGMFGHVSVRVPGTQKCFISPGASTDKTAVRAEHMFVYDVDGSIIDFDDHSLTIATDQPVRGAAGWRMMAE